MQELRHDGPDDDDGFPAILLEPLPEGSTERVAAHGAHGGREEGFAQARGAGPAHGGLEEADGGFEITFVEQIGGKIESVPEANQAAPFCFHRKASVRTNLVGEIGSYLAGSP